MLQPMKIADVHELVYIYMYVKEYIFRDAVCFNRRSSTILLRLGVKYATRALSENEIPRRTMVCIPSSQTEKLIFASQHHLKRRGANQ